MRILSWDVAYVVVVALLIGTPIGTSTATAQMAGTNAGSLGGYGGSMTATGSAMTMGGSAIPYAGKFAGFMPYGMSGSSSLTFQSRGASVLGANRTSFSLSTMPGGMSSLSSGMGGGLGAGSSMPSLFRSQGGMGRTGGMRSTSEMRGMGVMPPNFGYPFRQPPSLLSPSSSGMGMSM